MKKALWDACMVYVQARINTAWQAISSANDASTDDTKSSAGDKYETTREMMQQEIARNQQLLQNALQMQQLLHQLDIGQTQGYIRPGSLVKTNRGQFFVAVSAGQLEVGGQSCYAISAASPIGRLLLGKTLFDRFTFNHLEYEVLAIN
ncbi:hypothetical protein SAMN05216436_12919 [bacterium A37T11]|nr:hypothetical protein SAMN05216436_12919 [bacterium A37T11]